MGRPGWPELDLLMASMARKRTVLTQSMTVSAETSAGAASAARTGFTARAETRAKELLPSGRETREEGERSASGKSEETEKEKGGFNHVFPAHRYEWQNAEVRNDEAEGEQNEQVVSGIDPDLRGDPETDARWLAANPMGVPTERDLVCESKWRPVYRFVVVRRAA